MYIYLFLIGLFCYGKSIPVDTDFSKPTLQEKLLLAQNENQELMMPVFF